MLAYCEHISNSPDTCISNILTDILWASSQTFYRSNTPRTDRLQAKHISIVLKTLQTREC